MLKHGLGPSRLLIASSNKSYTLPYAHRRNIARLALNPRGNLLLSIDEDGQAILGHFPRRLALYHFSFKANVSALAFSPAGKHFAVGIGRRIEVWHTPATPDSNVEGEIEFAPFVKYHAHAGHHDDVQSIEWSSDSRFFLSASKDLSARIWSLSNEEGFTPTNLTGHRDAVLGAWFSNDQESVSVQLNLLKRALIASDLYRIPRRSPVSLGVYPSTARKRYRWRS